MGAMASQITSLTIVYPTVYSDADQRKHQSSASLAFVRGIHQWAVNSPHKGPVTRKCFHCWRHHGMVQANNPNEKTVALPHWLLLTPYDVINRGHHWLIIMEDMLHSSWGNPFCWHDGLNLIPRRIGNHIYYKVWDEIPYPFPNFNGATVEVWAGWVI